MSKENKGERKLFAIISTVLCCAFLFALAGAFYLSESPEKAESQEVLKLQNTTIVDIKPEPKEDSQDPLAAPLIITNSSITISIKDGAVKENVNEDDENNNAKEIDEKVDEIVNRQLTIKTEIKKDNDDKSLINQYEKRIPVLSENPTEEEVLESVSACAKLIETGGAVYLSYAQPQVPEEYHLTIKAEVYDSTGAIITRYVSDGGWLNNPSNYDAAAKSVAAKLGVDTLEGKSYMIFIRVSDANLASSAHLYLLECDRFGNKTVTTRVI